MNADKVLRGGQNMFKYTSGTYVLHNYDYFI